MGWCGGSEIMSVLIESVKNEHSSVRGKVYKDMIGVLELHDADTLYECLGEDPIYDEVFKDINPDYEDDEDE